MKNRFKRIIPLLLCFMTLTLLFSSCSGRKKLDEPIEFIIANDIHYISPNLLGDGSYFSTPKSTADGKLVHYIPEITDAFLANVIEKKPQALILSGDLTMNGARASHTELAEKLMKVKDAGIDVLVVPGNHDVDKTAVDYSGEVLQEAEAISSNDFIELYESFIPDSVVSRDSTSPSYIYNASEKLWILMLDTNIYGQCYVKDSTLEWVENQLKKAQESGIDVISVSHQNLYAHSDTLSFGYQLYNASKLLELYESYSVKCNFSAHIHIQSIKEGAIPEIATSSLAVTGLHYGEIVYNGRQIDYSAKSLDVSAYAEGIGSENPNLLDFASYATYYFEEVARVQVRESFAESEMTKEEVELLAETFAKINSAYFEGRKLDITPYSEGIELWRTRADSFLTKYIESMIESVKTDKLNVTVKFD